MKPMQLEQQRHAIRRAADIVGDRWTILILNEIASRGPTKFNELHRAVAPIALNILSARLKKLESHGMLNRTFYEQHPPRATYDLSERGRSMVPALAALAQWGALDLLAGSRVASERTANVL